MVRVSELAEFAGEQLQAYRLVNSKFPPIALFDDVADADEFEVLYQIQALTNPRLHNEVGRLELIARDQIPFGIPGCSYAIAPFTHVNPAGSRFSDGSFGVLYLADSMETALAEVRHHQSLYWSNVRSLNYERFVFRGLSCSFVDAGDERCYVHCADGSCLCARRLHAFPSIGQIDQRRGMSRYSLPLGAYARQLLLGADDAATGCIDCSDGSLRDDLEWSDHQCQQDQ